MKKRKYAMGDLSRRMTFTMTVEQEQKLMQVSDRAGLSRSEWLRQTIDRTRSVK